MRQNGELQRSAKYLRECAMVNEHSQPGETPDSPLELRWIPILAGAFVVLVAVVAMFALTAERAPSAGRAEMFSSIGGDFTLTGHTGEPVNLADFRGKVVLIYFGFTYCPDVCPIHLTLMSAALDQLGPRRDAVQPLFVTVDPARDTPEQMDRYVSYFDEALIGLTGSDTEIGEVTSSYAVAHQIVGDPASDNYTVNHTSVIYVVDREGAIVDLLNTDLTADELAAQLAQFL